MRVVVTGLDITTRMRIERDGIETIRAAGPFGPALAREIDGRTGFTGGDWSVPGVATVTHDWITVFRADTDGTVDRIVDADLTAIAHEIATRIVRTSGAAAD
jgi:purine nucleosidase